MTTIYDIKQEGDFSFIELGEGEPLVLLHGLFGSLSNWGDVLSEFSKTHRVIAPILPIYTMPLLSTSVSSLSKFLNDFWIFKNIPEANLVGNSLGGHVALVFTLKYPDRIKRLILTGSSGLYENSFGGTYPKRGDMSYVKEGVGKTFYNPSTATEELVEEVFETVNNREKVIRILAMAKSAIRHNMRKDVSKIDTPTCIIWGKQDTITPPEVAIEFNTLLPNSELHWVDKCGHAPMMEHPQEFNQILRKFLEASL